MSALQIQAAQWKQTKQHWEVQQERAQKMEYARMWSITNSFDYSLITWFSGFLITSCFVYQLDCLIS